MAGRSLSPDEVDRLQKFLADLRGRGETQAQIAQRSGISQQSVSRALAGVGAGYDFARAIARAYSVPIEELLTGRRENTAHYEGTRPVLGNMPGYAEAEADARKRAPYLPESAWVAARGTSGARLERVDASTVLGFAQLWANAGTLQEFPDDGETAPPVKKKR